VSRGRLFGRVMAEFVRVDVAAMTLGSADVDPDFREPRILSSAPDVVGELGRRELPPVRVRCQVEHESFEALNMTGAGNQPLSRVVVTLHFRYLEAQGLVDKGTGRALIAPGDRLTGFYDIDGALLETADLYVTEARSLGFGFGQTQPRRTLLLVVLEPRAASARTAL